MYLFVFIIRQNVFTKIVGHLQMEISRVTEFVLDKGARVHATLTSMNYRRSPLVQGGLEIARRIELRMPGIITNHTILTRYMQLVNEFYKEPFNEDIIGSFLSHPIDTPTGNEPKKKKAKKRKNSNDRAKGSKQVDETGRAWTVKSGDIKAMFANPKKPSKKIIVEID